MGSEMCIRDRFRADECYAWRGVGVSRSVEVEALCKVANVPQWVVVRHDICRYSKRILPARSSNSTRSDVEASVTVVSPTLNPCSIILSLRRLFKISIGFVEAPFPSMGGSAGIQHPCDECVLSAVMSPVVNDVNAKYTGYTL